MIGKKPTKITMATFLKEMVKKPFGLDDEGLNLIKDIQLDKKFFNDKNARNILMLLGTQIARATHPDFHVLLRMVEILDQIERGEDIKPIVSVMGLAGHGKDYQIAKLSGDFQTIGDVRFENELKFVLTVNKYFNDKKRLKEELLSLSKGFTYDPELLDLRTYTYLMGTGTEKLQNQILEKLENEEINTYEGFVSIYEEFHVENENMPTLQEMVMLMGYTKKENIWNIYKDIKSKAETVIKNKIEDRFNYVVENEKLDEEDREELAETIKMELLNDEGGFEIDMFDSEMKTFSYSFDEKMNINVELMDNYEFVNGEWVKEDRNSFLVESLGIKQEGNKFEFQKLRALLFDKFDYLKDRFNENGKYIDGVQESKIKMTDEDYEVLEENNVYTIFRAFEMPRDIVSRTLEELEDELVDYQLENVYKPFVNIMQENHQKIIKLTDGLIKQNDNNKRNELLLEFVEGLNAGEEFLKSYENEIETFMAEIDVDSEKREKLVPMKVKSLIGDMENFYDRKEDYEKEMRNSFKNFQEVYAKEFSDIETEEGKVSFLVELLETFGATRSNTKHESEALVQEIIERGCNVIPVVAFDMEEDKIQPLVDEVLARMRSKGKDNDKDPSPKEL